MTNSWLQVTCTHLLTCAAAFGAFRCDGEGRAQLRRKVRFRVPAGVVDGQVLRVKGQGHSGKYGGAPGDLLVKLQVR
jgi:DnaJ-class molecular chaperone